MLNSCLCYGTVHGDDAYNKMHIEAQLALETVERLREQMGLLQRTYLAEWARTERRYRRALSYKAAARREAHAGT